MVEAMMSDDAHFDDTAPCEDMAQDVDAFETQVVDFAYDETQLLDLAEETQIMDLAGETQVMDDFDPNEHMDTQLLGVSDNETECKSDVEGTETEHLSDLEDSMNIQLPDRSGDQVIADEKGAHCYQDDSGARSESLPLDSVVRSSGSSRRGFTSIRTASLRAAGLAARKLAPKNADSGSCSTVFSSGSCKLHSFTDCDRISNVETVDVELETAKINEKGLSNGIKSKVARSLARELFMEEDVGDEGPNDSLSGRRANFLMLSPCDKELAGLSYVDSQEPGELSQANALEFVDRFLKVNFLESDQDVTHGSTVDEIINPAATVKGPQKFAQQANLRSTLAGASIFDWDDRHEDEGGGEFFIKKKDLLFGTSCGSRNSCTRPRSSRHREPRVSQSAGKLRNEKEHDKIMGFHSDSKLMRSRNVGERQEINMNEKVVNDADLLLGLDSCSEEVLIAAPNAESSDMLNVGIDTQMAAEAMEELSTGLALATNDGISGDQGRKIRKGRCKGETTKLGLSKQSSVQESPRLSISRVITRSKQTKGITEKSGEDSNHPFTLRTRPKYVRQEFIVDSVKPRPRRSRLNVKDLSALDENESSKVGLLNVDGNRSKSILEAKLNDKGSLPVKRQRLGENVSASTPVARRTRQHIVLKSLSEADDVSGDCREERRCVDVVHANRDKRKRASKCDLDSDSSNAREKTLNLTTMADNVDTSNCRGRDLQHASDQVNGSGKKQTLLRVSGVDEVLRQPIARRTRSKRSAQYREVAEDGMELNPKSIISSEDAPRLSSDKHDKCSRPRKRAETHVTLEGSPNEMQKSSNVENSTPINLKMPTCAVSPICMGDEYHSPSCMKKLSLRKEFYRLSNNERRCTSPFKDFRQRRDMSSVRVLFSQHLEEDIIRQQKKILARLGVSVACSISDATHFVADTFVRTRNMLDAIASGKPIVTHLWLESCGQASCFIDEKNYILRDGKKEKELGFSMPNSLAQASCHPLLEGRRVLVTPKVKPGKEIISSLVKAVRGQVIERLGRSMSNNDKLLNDLLVLSCEEDFEFCLPLLEKGTAVYSSELLLDGIVTQKLDYDRFRLFMDHVKKTRSTLWLKKDGDQFLPVAKTK